MCNDQCVSHGVWQGLGERVRQFLASITLADLTRDATRSVRSEE
jgi:Rrf2 family iron-sulfur cluster assembly transcriptional regulator